MNSNKQKKALLGEKRRDKKFAQEQEAWNAGVRDGSIQRVDSSKIVSNSVLPDIPDYYRDKSFACVDCGRHQVWTAKKQKQWYEEAKGEIESRAIRCRKCRDKERQRKSDARRIHLEGLAKKNKRY